MKNKLVLANYVTSEGTTKSPFAAKQFDPGASMMYVNTACQLLAHSSSKYLVLHFFSQCISVQSKQASMQTRQSSEAEAIGTEQDTYTVESGF